MAEVQQVLLEFVKPVIDAWLRRNEIRAAKQAGSLTFWRDGMLEQLEAIASGEATKKTYKELKKNLNETAGPVTESMLSLKDARDRLAGTKFAAQIDKVLFDLRFGKSQIRSEIQSIVSLGEKCEKEKAIQVCNAIRTLNAELERLNRII